MERVRASDPQIQYASAYGSVWNGGVSDIRYGIQDVGDAEISSDWLSLLTARLSSQVRLVGSGLNGRATVIVPLGGGVRIERLRVLGSTEDLVNITAEVRNLAGEFTLDLREAVIKNNDCQSAQGTVWTDILTRMERRYGWVGPELAGPVTCENGDLVLMLNGRNAIGEDVSARLVIGLDGMGSFTADVTTTEQETRQVLTLLGFVAQGSNQFRYQHSLSGT